ncbi:four helix bundle protein [Clostridium sp. DL1XJH146]
MISYLEVFRIKKNVIKEKTFRFACRVTKMSKRLNVKDKEFVISNQVRRSGTSIGANVREADRGESKNDFCHKMNIALKEAEETEYWLSILIENDYLVKEELTLLDDCREICRILNAIVKTSRNRTEMYNSQYTIKR